MNTQLSLILGLVLVLAVTTSNSDSKTETHGTDDWDKTAAAAALDTRCQAWFDFGSADRGAGDTKTSCVCCHTVVPFALARPVLRKHNNQDQPTDLETKLLTQVATRVENWANLDTPALKLLYDFNAKKKAQSWGTEAVLNALMLANNDRQRGTATVSGVTKKALANLWERQNTSGSWDWLDFKLEPWESPDARYYGACLAAIAVGSAPAYYQHGVDATVDAKVKLMVDYLNQNLAAQSLHNRVMAIWASTLVDGILTSPQRQIHLKELLAKQDNHGGWSLSSLGQYSRVNAEPDAYATGLILHVAQLVGVKADDPQVAKGLAWLRTKQSATGEWKAYSVNKNRDLNTHVGKFMSDAGTAFAVLALGH